MLIVPPVSLLPRSQSSEDCMIACGDRARAA